MVFLILCFLILHQLLLHLALNGSISVRVFFIVFKNFFRLLILFFSFFTASPLLLALILKALLFAFALLKLSPHQHDVGESD